MDRNHPAISVETIEVATSAWATILAPVALIDQTARDVRRMTSETPMLEVRLQHLWRQNEFAAGEAVAVAVPQKHL